MTAPKRLPDQTDVLNAAFTKLEEELRELDWGVAAEVPMSNGWFLNYMKHDRDWGLYITGGTTCRLIKCSRETRVEAASLVQALVLKMRDVHAAKHDEVTDAIDRVQKVTEWVRSGASGELP